MERDETLSWIALSMVKGLGPRRIKGLLNEVPSPKVLFSLKEKSLREIHGISTSLAGEIANFSEWERAEKYLKDCEKEGIGIVTLHSKGYPQALKEIPDPPPLLYTLGSLEQEDRFSLSIVGPRNPTDYGIRVANMMATALSRSGITIVSGMARGIDTAAHIGALQSGGRTIAVLGSGINVPYPPENRGLMKQIARQGAVISEFPPGTLPEKGNFPRRNRIISGLSLGVLVVEAAKKSGALITAQYAVEHNRDVFAVPGMITSGRSAGTNKLIRSGAILVERPEDILEEIAPQLKGYLKEEKRKNLKLTEEEQKVVSFLSPEPVHIDEIKRATGVPTERLLALLTGLELRGIIEQRPGKRFCLPLTG
ncbi:MAG: DNA-protecting protein DprA [Nitrospirae bacterium]|nr:MAG: DNA-protecting protein DprA [Nitrospirota bacterium]